jgi:MioC protein
MRRRAVKITLFTARILIMKVAILSGSVYGSAEEVARHAEKLFKQQDIQAWYSPRATLQEILAFAPEALLAVTSTTGMGELPDNIMPLYAQLRDELPAALRGLPGGVIGLGDTSYDDTYCGGGEQMRDLFAELGVREVQEMLRLDASESVTPEIDAQPWLASFVKSLRA